MANVQVQEVPGNSIKATLIVLAVPPLLFLLVTAGFVISFVSRGASPDAAAVNTQAAASWILLVVQLLLAALAVILSRTGAALGRMRPAGGLQIEILLGAGLGAALGFLYIFGLAPAMAWLQAHVGDYVPAGAVLPTVGGSLPAFFIANVVLAPLVEEIIYRGWATRHLLPRLGMLGTTLTVCTAFGLLHWAGGFWYVLVVGNVAGGLFMFLRLWRGNMVAPYAAHLALNLVEFLLVAVGVGTV